MPINSNKKQIIKVCELLDRGYSTKDIMKKANVSKDCVKRIKAGKTFKDISKKYNFLNKK